MKKIIVSTFISMDGVIQAPGGPEEDTDGGFKYGGWTFPYGDETLGMVLGELYTQKYDLLLGRKTYDIWAPYWTKFVAEPPAGVDPGELEMAKTFNKVTKYVATHHPQTLSWNNSESLGNDIAARLREIKKSDGPMLLIQGSSELVHTILPYDLIDEFRLMIYPVVLGKGKRLFGNDSLPAAFKMTSSKVTSQGVICANYTRTGEVKTGSFAQPQS